MGHALLWCADGSREPSCPSVLDRALSQLRSAGIRHVSARVDAADLASARQLETHGFRLMGGQATHISKPRKHSPPERRGDSRVRQARREDHSAILRIAAEAFRDFEGRFREDSNLPADEAASFYEEWAAASIRGEMADRILVSEAPVSPGCQPSRQRSAVAVWRLGRLKSVEKMIMTRHRKVSSSV